jgi:hypothetical protein
VSYCGWGVLLDGKSCEVVGNGEACVLRGVVKLINDDAGERKICGDLDKDLRFTVRRLRIRNFYFTCA